MIDIVDENDIYDPIELEYPFKVYFSQKLQKEKDLEAWNWIKENIEGNWTFRNQDKSFLYLSNEKDVRKFPELFVYTFEKEEEAVAFKLRWL